MAMETVAHHGRTTAYRRPRGHDDGSRAARNGDRGSRRDREPGERNADDAAPVLYVHGSGGTHRAWVHQYGWREAPRPAVALDLSGHGASEDAAVGPDGVMTAYADDVVAVARETGADVICGNSLGGAVALTVALERDLPLSGLVPAGTGAKLRVAPDLLDALREEFEAAVSTLFGEDMLFHDADAATERRTREAMLDTGPEITYRDFAAGDGFDVRDRLAEIDVPALAVCGEHDGLTPPGFHEYLADELPDCRFVEIEGAAHLAMLERPAAFNRAVGAFLKGR